MLKWIKFLQQGLAQVVFPSVCVCCGYEETQKQRYLCRLCLEERFEDANPEDDLHPSGIILPEGVWAQHACWKFQKGGDLQHVIHQLKYERLPGLGVELGNSLGRRVQQHPKLRRQITKNSVIVPVPLHRQKLRSRGFNQAYEIARGFQQLWPFLTICPQTSVVRTKNTQSQTGFSRQRRLDNVRDAFRITAPLMFGQRIVIIIDDVLTTGATTFELAAALKDAGAAKIIILTLAQT